MQRCIIVFATTLLSTLARRLPDLYWNSSNALLALAEGDVAEMDVSIMDSLAIYCPFFNKTTPQNETETFVIFRVSQFEYENCIPDENARIVGRCSRPYIAQTIHTVFRHFTPLPSGLEYIPGNTYYFLSEPDRLSRVTKANRRAHCSKNGLRLKIRVHHSAPEDVPHRTRHQSSVHHRIHSHSSKGYSRSHSDKVNEANRWTSIGLNGITMKDAPSGDELSAIEQKQIHAPSTLLPEVYHGKSTDIEALVHQQEMKLYEIHEIDDYDVVSHSTRMKSASMLIAVAATLML